MYRKKRLPSIEVSVHGQKVQDVRVTGRRNPPTRVHPNTPKSLRTGLLDNIIPHSINYASF